MSALYYFIVRAIDLGNTPRIFFKLQFELTCLYMKQLPDIAIKLGIAVCLDDYLSVCHEMFIVLIIFPFLEFLINIGLY